jgi:hypothetical protein
VPHRGKEAVIHDRVLGGANSTNLPIHELTLSISS